MRFLLTSVAVIGILAAVSATGMYIYLQLQEQKYGGLDPVAAAERPITSEIEISGSTEANTEVDLSFKDGGIVSAVNTAVGDTVATGTVLMSLETSDLDDELAQAKADYAAAKAQLGELQQGTRSESLDVTQAQVQSDTVALAGAESSLASTISSVQTSAENVVHLTIDNYLSNPDGPSPAILVPTDNQPIAVSIVTARSALGPLMDSWDARVNSLSVLSESDLLAASAQFDQYLASIASLTGDFTQVFDHNNAITSADQAAIASASATVATDRTTLSSAEQAVRDAQAALDVAGKQMALAAAGNTSQSIAAAQAQAQSASAKVAQMQDSLNDQNITAPFGGTVSAVGPKVGETVAAGETAVSLIGNGPVKIEGYVPEVEYGELAIGAPVRIELDAFPGETFNGTLASIDPAATLQDGVPNFKITVYFANNDPRVRPGLTAEAYIQSGTGASALAIPQAAVHGTQNTPLVTEVTATSTQEVQVELGPETSDGYVEVRSGLSAGDTVLIDQTKQYKIVPN